MISSKENYLQLHRLIDDIPNLDDFIENKKSIIEYLKFLNRTGCHNESPFDIIDYEKLIYLELKYPNDNEILQLLNLIKIKIANGYEEKNKLIQRYTDDLVDNYISQNLFAIPYTERNFLLDRNQVFKI